MDETRWIRGFNELFADIDVSTVFTLWGNRNGAVNPDMASRKTLLMLPGMDEKLADKLIKARKTSPFKSLADVSVHLSPVAASKLTGWLTFNKSSYYAIVVYPESIEEKDKKFQTIYAYKEEVRVAGASQKPLILRVNPYAKVIIEH